VSSTVVMIACTPMPSAPQKNGILSPGLIFMGSPAQQPRRYCNFNDVHSHKLTELMQCSSEQVYGQKPQSTTGQHAKEQAHLSSLVPQQLPQRRPQTVGPLGPGCPSTQMAAAAAAALAAGPV